jgi:hypothetical protein
MGLSAINDLEWTRLASDGTKSIQIREQQFSPLIRGCTPGKSERSDIFVELDSGRFRNLLNHLSLRVEMRLPDCFEIDADGIPKIEIVPTPFRNVLVI